MPIINDKHDFIANTIITRMNKLLYLGYGCFPYFLVAYVLIFAATFHGS